jgi:hypothetical protein
MLKSKLRSLIYERKVSPTLKVLLGNAHKVLGREHKTDRVVKITTLSPSVGVKTLLVSASIRGESDTYKTTITFYDVEYNKTRTKKFSNKIEVPKLGPMYYAKPRLSSTQTRVNCTCKWFQFACEWYLKPENGLSPGRKPKPYTRLDGQPHNSPPSPNEQQMPCVCKHIYQLALKLEAKKMIGESESNPLETDLQLELGEMKNMIHKLVGEDIQ